MCVLLKLIIADIQLDVTVRIIAINVGQLIHIFFLSYTAQRLIDHSSDIPESMCVYYVSNSAFKTVFIIVFELMNKESQFCEQI